jgi:hypothetical protein
LNFFCASRSWSSCLGPGTKYGIPECFQRSVDGIPACWLVDGDTGEIIAIQNELRGKPLATTIEHALAKEHGT